MAQDEPTAVTPPDPEPGFAERARDRLHVALLWGIALAVLVALYFILAAFLPRWWAGRIGDAVDGSFARGTSTGLLIGAFGMALTLIFLGLAGLSLVKRSKIPAIIFAVLGLLAAIPNLLTLSVVVGDSNAAHAGERIFDVQAPAFRAASVWVVIIGAVIGLVVCFYLVRYVRRGEQLAEARAALDAQK
ncbi:MULTISPECIES: hypothetical protein [unclassified Gordonia (in: high G+C Gram-positive bacteria)]|uniref:hypothetical protein n=1 Tax=unclassified Gordonia (in: high G+C Gram-positive bacteria) TaxID=2657482 RepID=UPI001FFEB90E|nr:hypothetical protein [Gordonia sp. PP30]UQE73924.1 hypothetical protein MYK68_14425 [Gordonia sp. PP30]